MSFFPHTAKGAEAPLDELKARVHLFEKAPGAELVQPRVWYFDVKLLLDENERLRDELRKARERR